MTPAPVGLDYDPVALILAQNRAILALTEKIGDLEREIKALKAIPQYRGGGMRLQQADERYLQLAGGTLSGNVNMQTHQLQFGTGGLIRRYAADQIAIRTADDSDWASLYANNAWLNRLQAMHATARLDIQTGAGAASNIRLRSHDGAAQKDCAKLIGGSIDMYRVSELTMLAQKMMTLGTYTNAQRPAAGTAGRWIFNTDDGMPNYDDGVNWRDINGNIT